VRVRMCVSVCVCVCVCIMYICIPIGMFLGIYVYVCMYVCIYECRSLYIYMYCVYMYAFFEICINITLCRIVKFDDNT